MSIDLNKFLKYEGADKVLDYKDMSGLKHYLKEKLWPIGDLKFVGSFFGGKYPKKCNDADVVIATKIDNVDTIVEHVESFIREWRSMCYLPLDLFIYGNFQKQTIEKVVEDPSLGGPAKYTFRFNRSEVRKWNAIKIITLRWLQSLLGK
jgi:hypothetical protein